MRKFEVLFKPSVEKDLRRLPQLVLGRVLERIEALAQDPFPPRRVKLTGAEHLFRIRVGHYRIIYEADATTGKVIIHYVRHRREAYRNL